MTDKQIIEEDMVNAKDFCPYYSCEVDCYEARMCQWFVDTLQQLKRKEQACKEWKEEYRAKVEELNELEEKLLRKEQECKELEKELAKVYEDIKLSPLCYKCDEEECLQKEIDKLKAENDMLRDELRFYKDFYYACN